jgi:Uma2 family endonuclease
MELHESPAVMPYSHGGQVYVRAPRPVHFPSEERPEDKVPETKRHLEARTTLYLLLKDALSGAASVGCEQFVYWDAADPQRCLSPDAFVKLGSREQDFDTWKVWLRGAPDVAVEIVSDHDRGDAKWSSKLARYQASGIGEVVRFDPDNEEQPVRVWDRVDGDLVERSRTSPTQHACAALGFWWVVTPSPFGPLLRLARDREGNDLLPTPSEERLRLEEQLAEERKARSVAEHERNIAEQERKLAEQKLLEAERQIEELRAELLRLRGERG